MADLVREFQNTRVVMALLPFAAVIGGIGAVAGIAAEVAEKIKEWREEQEQLRLEMTRFDTGARNAFNSLEEKLIAAEKRSDELKNDHLGAVRHELQLINMQTFDELQKSMNDLGKLADDVFKHLEDHWFWLGTGADGAKHALDSFKTNYEALASSGQKDKAAGLLTGTLNQAREVLALQQRFRDIQSGAARQSQAYEGDKILDRLGALQGTRVNSVTDHMIAAQQVLVKTLQDQAAAQEKIQQIANVQSGNTIHAEQNRETGQGSERARQAAATQQAIAEAQLQGDRAVAMGRLEIARASIEQRLRVELDFADRDYAIKQQGLRAEIAAQNKSGADYANQVAALQGKERELTAQHLAQRLELTSKAAVEQNQRDLANFEAGERTLIQATQEGSAARLQAVDQAMQATRQRGLQESDFYRTLGTERAAVERQMNDEQTKLNAESRKIDADQQEKMSQVALQGEVERRALLDSARRVTLADRIGLELSVAEQEYQIQQKALEQQESALNTSAKDYEVRLRAIQNRELELAREHENAKTAIIDSATKARNQQMLAAEQASANAIATTLGGLVTRHLTFSDMLRSATDQAANSLIHLAIASMDANERGKIPEAAAAARAAFLSTMKAFPSPINLIAAPLAGATAFTSMMGFADGGVVPGVGRGDIVPAMLTPGEGVVPKGVMDGLANLARSGGFESGGNTTHVHVNPTYHVNTIDGNGMRDALNQHTDVLQKHFESAVRKMNR